MNSKIEKEMAEKILEKTGYLSPNNQAQIREIINFYFKKIELLQGKVPVEIMGWKGKSGIDVHHEKAERVYVITEYRKDKDSGEVAEQKHTIPERNVEKVWNLIQMNIGVGDKIQYRELVPKVIDYYGWKDVDVDSFNGGRNRGKYYFSYYYYPVKCLEAHFKAIHYKGGVITRIK